MNDCYFDKKDWRTDMACTNVDGDFQRMLEEARKRSEDRDEERIKLTSLSRASIR